MRSIRRICALAVAVAVVVVAPDAASAAFQFGVASGDVTSSSALLWGKATKGGKYTLEVSTDKGFHGIQARQSVTAKGEHDFTLQAKVGGLKNGRLYFYRFRGGGSTSVKGQFKTAPSPGSKKTIRFAWSADADAVKAPGASSPFYNNFGVYNQMRKEKNDFNVNLGDTIYSDSEVPGAGPVALTVQQKWAKYKQNLALSNLANLRGSGAFYSHWDDHEFINDFTKAENGNTIYKAGVTAFRDYAPVSYTSKDGLYRSYRWGKNLEVFLLDERSFRSAKASANHTCDNPQSGQPDLAPTAPQGTRTLFSALVPSLSQPVSQQCLDTINSKNRTMLGKRQLDKFEHAVSSSAAKFRVIMNEVPIMQFYALPYDRWEGYEAERQHLLGFLHDNVKNVIFLTTDVHANLVSDARFQTLGSGGVKNSGILDVTTGPVATRTFQHQIDDTVSPGSGKLISTVFLLGQPPNGVGMQCAGTDVYSYGQVSVSSSKLTIGLKDINGKAVKSDDGKQCGPFTVKAK